MNRFILVLLIALAAGAQSTELIFEPKNLLGDRADRAIKFVSSIMAGRAVILWEPVLRQAVIRGGKDDATQALQLLQKYDVPEVKRPRPPVESIEYTIHLVGAFATTGHARGSALPPDVDAAVQQMKVKLPYKEYRLLDVIPIATHSNGRSVEYSGILPSAAVGTNVKYFYKALISSPYVEDLKTVINSEFSFFVSIPGASEKAGEVGIRTDLRIKEGQKVVLGKIKLDDGEDGVFLIVTVKLN